MTTSGNDTAAQTTNLSQNGLATPGLQISIALLQRERTLLSNGGPTSPALRSASAMLQDLFVAADLSFHAESDERIVAQAASIESVLQVVRRIYALLMGFCGSPTGSAVCVSICVGGVGLDAGPSADCASRFLRDKSLSDLVVLSPEAYEQARVYPGLHFTALRSHGLSGCWQLCRPEWFQVESAVSAISSAAADQKQAMPANRNARAEAPIQSPGTRTITQRFRSRTAVFGFAALVVTVTAAGIALYSHRGTAASEGHSGKPALGPRMQAEPQTAVPPLVSAGPSAPGHEKPVSIATPPRPSAKKNTPERPSESDEPVKQHTAGGMSGEDIQRTLFKADSASGNGQYGQAIAYYNFILRRDPHNSAALRGRARAEQNRPK